jgi:O-antigen/teichoic acid export membrane protein
MSHFRNYIDKQRTVPTLSEPFLNHHNPNKSMREEIRDLLAQKSLFTSIKQLSFYSAGGMLAQAIMIVYAIIIARQLGPEQLGVYSGLYAILGVTITIVNFGLDQWMLNEAQNYKSVRLLSGQVILIKLMFGIFWCMLCVVLLPISRPETYLLPLVILGVGDVLSDVIFNTVTTTWTITRKIKQINILLLLSRGGKLSILLLLTLANQLSLTSILGSRFVITLIILMISLSLLKPRVRFDELENYLLIIKKSTVFGLSEILAMIYAQIDVAILSYFSIRDTGLYSPASGLIHALFIIPNSVFIFLIPLFSKKLKSEENSNINSITKIVLIIFAFVGISLSSSLFVAGDFIIELLLGGQFNKTTQVLKVLSPVMFFKSLSFGLALILMITGNQQKRLLPQLIVCFFNISLNVIFIPRFGLISVAWIYTLSELILMLGYLMPVIGINKYGIEQKIQAK